MEDNNQLENNEETGKIGNESQKEDEEDTIEQLNRQVLDDKENNEPEQKNIINENQAQYNTNNIDNINNTNNANKNNEIIEVEIKDKTQNNQSNMIQQKNTNNLTLNNNNFNIQASPNNNNYINNNNNNSNNINNNMNIKNANKINKNNLIHNNKNHISKTNENVYSNKFENYNDELKRYYFNKEYSNFHINIDESFMERMQFDIYKRQIKEERLNSLIEQNKVRIDEEKKIETFNRLIEDANRRLKAQMNMEDLKEQLNDDLISSSNIYKKYNHKEWNEIYNKRFKAYQDNVNKRKEDYKKICEEERKKKEEEIINLCPNRKAPIKHIIEMSQKMYDEAKKREMKMKEKKRNTYNLNLNVNEISTNSKYNQKYKKENNDKNVEGNDYNNDILNQFLINNINYYNSKSNEKIQKKIRNKSISHIKTPNKAKIKMIPYRNKSKNNIIGYTHKNYMINNKLINLNRNSKNKDEINYMKDNSYNLEEERRILIQMAEQKKLPIEAPLVNNPGSEKNNELNNNQDYDVKKNIEISNNNSINEINYNNQNNNNEQNNLEVNKIIEEFFIRNMK